MKKIVFMLVLFFSISVFAQSSKVGTYVSSKVTTSAIGAVAKQVFPASGKENILSLPNVCIYVKNTDDADPFTDAAIFVSADNATWTSLAWTSCDNLVFGEVCTYCISGNAYGYIKVEVTGATGNEVSTESWLTGNTG